MNDRSSEHEYDRVDKLLRRMPMFSQRLDEMMGRNGDKVPSPFERVNPFVKPDPQLGNYLKKVFDSRRGF